MSASEDFYFALYKFTHYYYYCYYMQIKIRETSGGFWDNLNHEPYTCPLCPQLVCLFGEYLEMLPVACSL